MKLGHKIGVGFLVAGAAVVGFFGVCLMDEAPPEDADLALHRLDLAREENGYTYALEAARVLYWPGYNPLQSADEAERAAEEAGQSAPRPKPDVSDKRLRAMLRGTAPWDADVADDLVANNGRVFALMEQALACPHFQFPPAESFDDHVPEGLSPLFSVGELYELRGWARLKRGAVEKALEDAHRLLRFGRDVRRGNGPVHAYLIGVTLSGMGLRLVEAALLEREAVAGRLRRWARRLRRYAPEPGNLADAYRAEYATVCFALDDLKAGRETLRHIQMPYLNKSEQPLKMRLVYIWHFKVNATKRLLAEHVRTRIANARRPFAERQTIDLVRLAYGRRPWAPSLIPSNRAGRMLLSLLESGFIGVLHEKCRSAVRLAALRTRLALRAFKVQHGRLPERLDDLVPAYLDAVPCDDFDGKPLRYNPQKRVVYSVGKDLEDDGGMRQEEIDAWWTRTQPEMAAEGGKPMPTDLPDPSWPIEF